MLFADVLNVVAGISEVTDGGWGIGAVAERSRY